MTLSPDRGTGIAPQQPLNPTNDMTRRHFLQLTLATTTLGVLTAAGVKPVGAQEGDRARYDSLTILLNAAEVPGMNQTEDERRITSEALQEVYSGTHTIYLSPDRRSSFISPFSEKNPPTGYHVAAQFTEDDNYLSSKVLANILADGTLARWNGLAPRELRTLITKDRRLLYRYVEFNLISILASSASDVPYIFGDTTESQSVASKFSQLAYRKIILDQYTSLPAFSMLQNYIIPPENSTELQQPIGEGDGYMHDTWIAQIAAYSGQYALWNALGQPNPFPSDRHDFSIIQSPNDLVTTIDKNSWLKFISVLPKIEKPTPNGQSTTTEIDTDATQAIPTLAGALIAQERVPIYELNLAYVPVEPTNYERLFRTVGQIPPEDYESANISLFTLPIISPTGESNRPSEEPTATPTEEPTATPTDKPTATREPTATRTQEPTSTPSPEPSPTARPTETQVPPTQEPTRTTTPTNSATPFSKPIENPTPPITPTIVPSSPDKAPLGFWGKVKKIAPWAATLGAAGLGGRLWWREQMKPPKEINIYDETYWEK